MENIICQTGIVVLGLLSVFFVARKNIWGPICGLLSEPFWFWSSWQNEQWGIFLLSVVYTVMWTYAVFRWREDDKEQQPPITQPAGAH